MSALPVWSYNLARLGNAGDTVRHEADAAECAAIAQWSKVVSVERFVIAVEIKKLSVSRFVLAYTLEVSATQACVVTLEPVPAGITRPFQRELYFPGKLRRPEPEVTESIDISGLDEDVPETIESLHYDLAAPALEEYLLALDPYPRCPGVEFSPAGDGPDARENPFAVLKSLKNQP